MLLALAGMGIRVPLPPCVVFVQKIAGVHVAPALQSKEARRSFLKKRTKRLLLLRRTHDPGHGLDLDAGGGIKVFCFFSSEKKAVVHIPSTQRISFTEHPGSSIRK
jgi:hypothetical protein